MANDIVNLDPDDLERLAHDLETFSEMFRGSAKRVLRSLGSVNWHDRQKDQFEERFRQSATQFQRILDGDMEDLARNLRLLARKARELREVRF